jgi:hypothetical protein
VLIIYKALLSPALINAARRWPPTQNSIGQCRGGAALKYKLTGAPGWHPLLINIPCHRGLHHQHLPHHQNIFSPSNAFKYDMMTKGGLSPDTRENRASSGHPPPKKYQTYHSATSRVIVPAKQAKADKEWCPSFPRWTQQKQA